MRKLLLLAVLIASCNPACQMTSRECHELCYPKAVVRFDKDGCFCEGSGPAVPK